MLHFPSELSQFYTRTTPTLPQTSPPQSTSGTPLQLRDPPSSPSEAPQDPQLTSGPQIHLRTPHFHLRTFPFPSQSPLHQKSHPLYLTTPLFLHYPRLYLRGLPVSSPHRLRAQTTPPSPQSSRPPSYLRTPLYLTPPPPLPTTPSLTGPRPLPP